MLENSVAGGDTYMYIHVGSEREPLCAWMANLATDRIERKSKHTLGCVLLCTCTGTYSTRQKNVSNNIFRFVW